MEYKQLYEFVQPLNGLVDAAVLTRLVLVLLILVFDYSTFWKFFLHFQINLVSFLTPKTNASKIAVKTLLLKYSISKLQFLEPALTI